MYPSEDGHDKGSEKKAATRLLKRMAESHLLDLIDVVVCDALYADAEFIRTATSGLGRRELNALMSSSRGIKAPPSGD